MCQLDHAEVEREDKSLTPILPFLFVSSFLSLLIALGYEVWIRSKESSEVLPPTQLRSGNTELYLKLNTLLAQDVFFQLLYLYRALGGVQQPVSVSEWDPGGRERGQRQPGLGQSPGVSLRLETLVDQLPLGYHDRGWQGHDASTAAVYLIPTKSIQSIKSSFKIKIIKLSETVRNCQKLSETVRTYQQLSETVSCAMPM